MENSQDLENIEVWVSIKLTQIGLPDGSMDIKVNVDTFPDLEEGALFDEDTPMVQVLAVGMLGFLENMIADAANETQSSVQGSSLLELLGNADSAGQGEKDSPSG